MKKTILTILIAASTCCLAFAQEGRFKLMQLPYATDALEPVISKETMELHHGKHLLAYVNNLNAAIVGTQYENMAVEEMLTKSTGAVFNNAGQMLNHNLFFMQFSPNGQTEPKGKLAEAINAKWGSFEAFQKDFEKKGAALFGSGWVWLAKDQSGKLVITQESNGSNPAARGFKPIFGIDVWEHAYYLDYQNKRGDYLKNIWKIVDWRVVEKRY